MKRILAILLCLVLFCTACGTVTEPPVEETTSETQTEEITPVGEETEQSKPTEEAVQPEQDESEPVEESEQTETPVEPSEEESTEEPEPVPEEDPVTEPEETGNNYVIAIDAGHQAVGNPEQEPIGPGASETKAKVSSGTTGTTTGIPEYELTLALSLLLQEELESRGYTVVMTRTTHDVDLGNIDRASVANDANADVFLRIHANGSTDSSVNGAMTICQTSGNPYNGALHDASYALSEAVLDELVAATGCTRQYIWETDTMSGINWCQVPVTIVEVGYMTNPEEDTLLATEEYRALVAEGIANGVDRFLGQTEN